MRNFLKTFFFLILSAFILTACKEDPVYNDLPGTLDSYLSPPDNPCEAIFENPIVDNGNEGGPCVNYDEKLYKKSTSEGIAWMNKEGNSANKKQNFINYMAPIAVKVQQKTGLPASLIMAQAIQETGWGTSNLFAKGNAAFGHSCWSKQSSHTRKVQISDSPAEFKDIKVKCKKKRPSSEGGRYLTFENMEDSVWAYADNVLYNEKTAKYYGKVRYAVKKAALEGKAASYRDVIPGLSSYAADPGYQKKLGRLIKSKNLYKFDNLKLCEDTNGVGLKSPNSCDERVDNSGRTITPDQPPGANLTTLGNQGVSGEAGTER